MAYTDPVKLLKEIAEGYSKIASNIKKIKVPKKNTWAKDLKKEMVALTSQNTLLTTELEKLGKEFRELEARVAKMDTVLDEAGLSLDKMTGHVKKDTKELDNSSKHLKVFTNLWANFKRQLVWYPTKTVTFAMLKGLAAIPKLTAEYNAAMTDLGAISRSSNAEMTRLDNTIVKLGTSTKYSMVEIAKASKTLAQAGVRGEELTASLKPITDLAAATSSSIETATKVQTTVMRAYSVSTDDFTKISDSLVNAVVNTRLSLNDLNTAFSYVASAAAQTGVTYTETIALLGALRNAGLEASTAATGLRMALLKITAPTMKAQKVLDKVGLTKEDLNIAEKGIFNVLKQINKLTKTDIIDIFGARSANAILAIKNVSEETIKSLEDLIKIQGTSSRVAQEQLGSITNTWKLLGDNLTNLAVNIGSIFTDDVIDGASLFTKFIGGAAEAVKEYSKTIKVLVEVTLKGAIFYNIGKATQVLATMTVDSFSKMNKFFNSLTRSTRGLTGVFAKLKSSLNSLLTPTNLFAFAVTALAYVVYDAISDINNFQNSLDRLKLSVMELNEALGASTYEMHVFKDLELPPAFNEAKLKLLKKKTKEQINDYYDSALKAVKDQPETKELIEEMKSISLMRLASVSNTEDLDKFNVFLTSQTKTISSLLSNAIGEIEEEQRKDFIRSFSNLGLSIVYHIRETLFHVSDKSIEAIKKFQGKLESSSKTVFEGLVDQNWFTQIAGSVRNFNSELVKAEGKSEALLALYKDLNENKTILGKSLDRLLVLQSSMNEKNSTPTEINAMAKLIKDLQNLLLLGLQFNASDKQGGANDELATAGEELGRAAMNSYLQGFYKRLNEGGTNKEISAKTEQGLAEMRKVIFDTTYQYMKSQGKTNDAAYNLADQITNSLFAVGKGKAREKEASILTKRALQKINVEIETAQIKKRKLYKQDLSEMSNLNAALIQLNVVRDAKIQKINKQFIEDSKDVHLQYTAEQVKSNRLAKVRDQDAIDRASTYQKYVTDINKKISGMKEASGFGSLVGPEKIQALENYKAGLLELRDTFTGFEDNPALVKVLNHINNLITETDNRIKKTTTQTMQNAVTRYRAQINDLVAERDRQDKRGNETLVEDLNRQIFGLYDLIYGIEMRLAQAKIASGEYSEAEVARIKAQLEAFRDSLDANLQDAIGMYNEFKQGASAAFSDFFNSIISGNESLGDSFRNLGRSILKSMQDVIIKRLGEKLVDSLLPKDQNKLGLLMKFFKIVAGAYAGGGGSSGDWSGVNDPGIGGRTTTAYKFHSGGVVGKGGNAGLYPSSLFYGAPRFHNGTLAANEVPAILETGETVIPNNAKIVQTAPKVTINMENNTNKDVEMETVSSKFDGEEFVIQTIIKDAQNNGAMRQFGLASQQGGY